jgi:hypothetical protein
MYLCRKLTELSYPEIGRLFNDKHHSTVMHSVEKIERMIEDDAISAGSSRGFYSPTVDGFTGASDFSSGAFSAFVRQSTSRDGLRKFRRTLHRAEYAFYGPFLLGFLSIPNFAFILRIHLNVIDFFLFLEASCSHGIDG